MISHEIKPYDDRSYVVTSYHRFVYDIRSYYTTSIEPVCCARKAATVQTSKLDRRPEENNLINFDDLNSSTHVYDLIYNPSKTTVR